MFELIIRNFKKPYFADCSSYCVYRPLIGRFHFILNYVSVYDFFLSSQINKGGNNKKSVINAKEMVRKTNCPS